MPCLKYNGFLAGRADAEKWKPSRAGHLKNGPYREGYVDGYNVVRTFKPFQVYLSACDRNAYYYYFSVSVFTFESVGTPNVFTNQYEGVVMVKDGRARRHWAFTPTSYSNQNYLFTGPADPMNPDEYPNRRAALDLVEGWVFDIFRKMPHEQISLLAECFRHPGGRNVYADWCDENISHEWSLAIRRSKNVLIFDGESR